MIKILSKIGVEVTFFKIAMTVYNKPTCVRMKHAKKIICWWGHGKKKKDHSTSATGNIFWFNFYGEKYGNFSVN